MGRRDARQEHLAKKATPAAVEAKKMEGLPAYAALKASKKKSFENRIYKKLPKNARYDPSAQSDLLRAEWFDGKLPDDYKVGFRDLDLFLNRLVEGGVRMGTTLVDTDTKKVEGVLVNPALGFVEVRDVLANTSVHEVGCHGGAVADGLFSEAKGWEHGEDFQRYAALAGDKTCTKITAEPPKAWGERVAGLMMRLAEKASKTSDKASETAAKAIETAVKAIDWVVDHVAPVCHKEYAKRHKECKAKKAALKAELKKIAAKQEVTCHDVYLLLKAEKKANEAAAAKNKAELSFESSDSSDDEDYQPPKQPSKKVTPKKRTKRQPKKGSPKKRKPAHQGKPKRK